jgi:hypothetical protein
MWTRLGPRGHTPVSVPVGPVSARVYAHVQVDGVLPRVDAV